MAEGLAKTVELVQTSWQQIEDAGVTYEVAGGILFRHIFRIAPQALPLFSFGKAPDAKVDDALFESAALRTHSAKVVATVAGAVKKLGQLEELAPVLAALGTKHVEYGVIPAHYEVVGEALIATLKDALGEAFTPEVKAAWVAVYGIVKTTMIGDNYPSEEPPRTPEDEDISTKTPNCKCTLI